MASATFDKRKGQARLDIPMMSLLDFEKQSGSDVKQEVEEESNWYSVYYKRRRKRVEMEAGADAPPKIFKSPTHSVMGHSCALDLYGDPQMAFFRIFDRHGGSIAAEHVSKRIGEKIMEEMKIRRGEAVVDVVEAVKNGYLKTDIVFIEEDVEGGTCCVTAFAKKGELIVSNAGW